MTHELMNYTPLLFIGAMPVFLLGQIYLLGRRMSAPEKMLRPTPNGLSDQQRETISHYIPAVCGAGTGASAIPKNLRSYN